MKKIIYGTLATVSGLVLLFSYRTSLGADLVPVPTASTTGTTSGATTGGAGGGGSDSSSSTGTDTPGSTGTGSTASGTLKNGSYTGDAAQTQYGPVQVQVTVSGGKLTAVDVPEFPTESPRDAQINGYAVPQLVSETLSAQNARIDMISGATFTSDGYLQSLQSALDQAAR
ncbi:FMN-binding protein [Microbacterium elymi]|uniref:FMN-binding protein n=1 Tax=Microbacterium elymi TaxID=2909587 RepID=A0ABY5NI59_9MICO|nr:FMN-binding protein [Microbacterium elymi]UUT34847.1 FMN-binding protein [Microbacterium elymi]